MKNLNSELKGKLKSSKDYLILMVTRAALEYGYKIIGGISGSSRSLKYFNDKLTTGNGDENRSDFWNYYPI